MLIIAIVLSICRVDTGTIIVLELSVTANILMEALSLIVVSGVAI